MTFTPQPFGGLGSNLVWSVPPYNEEQDVQLRGMQDPESVFVDQLKEIAKEKLIILNLSDRNLMHDLIPWKTMLLKPLARDLIPTWRTRLQLIWKTWSLILRICAPLELDASSQPAPPTYPALSPGPCHPAHRGRWASDLLPVNATTAFMNS